MAIRIKHVAHNGLSFQNVFVVSLFGHVHFYFKRYVICASVTWFFVDIPVFNTKCLDQVFTVASDLDLNCLTMSLL